jgi:hypothetical protein
VAVVNRIKELPNVHIHDPASFDPHRLFPEALQRLMCRSFRSETMRAVFEVLLVDRFQNHDDRSLEYFILEGWNAQSALPTHPDLLRDLSPSPIHIIPFAAFGSRSSEFAEGTILTSLSWPLTGVTPPSP